MMNLNSPSFFVRLILALIFLYSLGYNFTYCRWSSIPFLTALRQKYYYLTIWNYTLHTFYYCLTVLSTKRTKLIDTLYSSLVFPIGLLVVLSFWSIYFIDRELVYPKEVDKIIPAWQNHAMHTLPLIGCLIENYFNYHKYPKMIKGMTISISFGAIYLAWTFFLAYTTGFWVYGVLEVLDNFSRFLFILSQLILVLGAYKLGEYINNSLIWKSLKID